MCFSYQNDTILIYILLAVSETRGLVGLAESGYRYWKKSDNVGVLKSRLNYKSRDSCNTKVKDL